MLVDVTPLGLTGKDGEAKLGKLDYFEQEYYSLETKSPFITSGIRIGTPACDNPRNERKRNGNDCPIYR